MSASAQDGRPARGSRSALSTAVRMAVAGSLMPLASLATGPLLARALGPEGRGYVSAILAPIALVPILLALGLGDASAYCVAKRRGTAAEVGLALGAVGAAAGAAGAAGLWVLAPVLLEDYQEGIGLMRALALTLVPAMALTVVGGARIGEGRYDILVVERWLAALGRLGLVVALALAGALTVVSTSWAQVGSLVLVQLVVLVGLRWPRTTIHRMRHLAGEGIHFGVRAWGGELAGILTLRLDQALMLPLAGPRQLGLYAVAVSLAEVPQMLIGDVRFLLLSEASARDDPSLVARASRTCLLVMVLPLAAAVTLTPVVIPLFFGSVFAPAVPMAQVLLVATLSSSLNLILGSGVSAIGRPGVQSTCQVAGLVVAVLGIVVLVPPFGGMGAAFGSLVSYSVTTLALVLASRRLIGQPARAFLVPRVDDVRDLMNQLPLRRLLPGSR